MQLSFFGKPLPCLRPVKKGQKEHSQVAALLAHLQPGDLTRYRFLGAFARQCGVAEAIVFCAKHPGKRYTPERVVALLPANIAHKMDPIMNAWEAEAVKIPKIEKAFLHARNRAIRAEREQGSSIKTLCARWRLKRRAVYEVLSCHEKTR